MLVIAAILIVGAISFTLLVPGGEGAEATGSSEEELLRSKRIRLEESLADLEFERRVGKLSEADFRMSDAELREELARLEPAMEPPERTAEDEPPAAAAKPGAGQTGRRCPYCGAVFEREMKFCGECGRPMTGGPPA